MQKRVWIGTGNTFYLSKREVKILKKIYEAVTDYLGNHHSINQKIVCELTGLDNRVVNKHLIFLSQTLPDNSKLKKPLLNVEHERKRIWNGIISYNYLITSNYECRSR